MLLRFDADARFSCAQCARCCRRFRIALTPAEAQRYRAAGVARLFRETADAAEGATRDPLETLAGQVIIRQRPDGACGFLSPDNRCRIHEELGAAAKPLSCRLFPFAFHPLEDQTVVTASATCPSVVASRGPRLADQAPELRRLARAWSAAFPEPARPVRLDARRSLDAAALATLREVLEGHLLFTRAGGTWDARACVGRVAGQLEDLTRWRVARLDDSAFQEYLALTGRHAMQQDAPPRAPSSTGGMLFRGVLLAVLMTRLRYAEPRRGGMSRRFAAAGLLLHLHGAGPAAAGFDLRRARRAKLDLGDTDTRALVRAYLLSAVRTAGAGAGTVVEELSTSVAVLLAAMALAADAAARRGEPRATAQDLGAALPDAADVQQASGLGRLLRSLAASPGALHLFASARAF